MVADSKHSIMKVSISQLPYFGLTYRRICIYFMLATATALLEGFGMTIFLPLLEYVEQERDLVALAASSEMWKHLIWFCGSIGISVSLASLTGIAVGVMLLRVFAVYLRQIYTSWLGLEITHETRSKLMEGVFRLGYSTFVRLSSGSILNILNTELPRAGSVFYFCFLILSNIFVCISFLCMLLWLSTKLTCAAIVFFFISLAISKYVIRNTRSESFEATEHQDAYSRALLDRLNAFRLIALTNKRASVASALRRNSASIRDKLFNLQFLNASIDLSMEPLMLISGGMVLFLGLGAFQMSISQVGIYLAILLRILPLAKSVVKTKQSIEGCYGSLNAIISFKENIEENAEDNTGNVVFTRIHHAIVLNNVSYTYPGADNPAINKCNLIIPAGKTTAFVGPSGSGKTTLAELLPRLRTPQAGTILYDGLPGEDFELGSLRRAMAFVSQESAFLSGSIRENLLFVKTDADENEIRHALTLAHALEFVNALPQGLDTHLGDHGVRLSGGQRQRLSLARALLQDTSMLILDEPTSALDSETEADIQRAIEMLRAEGKTIVIIAHRFSTIRHADHIVVLQNGNIREQGSHDDLMISEQWYARVSNMQSTNS